MEKRLCMKSFVYVFILLLLSGCVSLKQERQKDIKEISSLTAFDGIYSNVNPLKSASLWSQLNMGQVRDTANFSTTKIELKAIGKNQLKAIWTSGTGEPQELLLKGKLKNNYFVSRHKRTIIPIPLVYGAFTNNQFQLALSQNNTLLVDRLNNEWGWVFLFLASSDKTFHYEYKAL